jgi:hypothetical protein
LKLTLKKKMKVQGRKRLLLTVVATLVLLIILSEFTTIKSSGVIQDITSSLQGSSDTQRKISNLTKSSIRRNNNSESSEKSLQQQPEGQDGMHLIQVLSPYVVVGGDDYYSPLDLNQWAAIASIQRAQIYLKRAKRHLKYSIHLDFVCAVLESDQEALAHLPCRQVLLTRSTQMEYL